MTTREKTRRPSVRSRRAGYLVGAVLNSVLLVLINGRPGWDAVPFLTAGFASVVGAVDLALIASLVTSLVHLWRDPEWLVVRVAGPGFLDRSAGDQRLDSSGKDAHEPHGPAWRALPWAGRIRTTGNSTEYASLICPVTMRWGFPSIRGDDRQAGSRGRCGRPA